MQGARKIHVRAVRDVTVPVSIPNHFTDNGDGSISDNITGLIWQKITSGSPITWEQALSDAENLSLAGVSDWRLPNIKELQSLNDESKVNPSVNATYFSSLGVKNIGHQLHFPTKPQRPGIGIPNLE